MPTRHELWCWLFGLTLGCAFGGSIVWAIQPPPPEWYHLEHVADWFVAAFTGLLAFVTYRLVQSTNKLWAAGERQLSITAETATRQLRAYVLYHTSRLISYDPQQGNVRVHVSFRNLGLTPAYDVQMTVTLTSRERDSTEPFEVIEAPRSSGPLAPGGEIETEIFSSRPFTLGELARFKNDELDLYVLARLRYRDAFDVGRCTDVRLVYTASHNLLRGTPAFSTCAEGNRST